ncbi:MAG: hypothetical protein V7L01_11615 [Nostoc sp.]|uniref:hypothetical protein n=1 Tax=Nostoc sp. TaxID=1180 RepID=UPI002FF88D15
MKLSLWDLCATFQECTVWTSSIIEEWFRHSVIKVVNEIQAPSFKIICTSNLSLSANYPLTF